MSMLKGRLLGFRNFTKFVMIENMIQTPQEPN